MGLPRWITLMLGFLGLGKGMAVNIQVPYLTCKCNAGEFGVCVPADHHVVVHHDASNLAEVVADAQHAACHGPDIPAASCLGFVDTLIRYRFSTTASRAFSVDDRVDGIMAVLASLNTGLGNASRNSNSVNVEAHPSAFGQPRTRDSSTRLYLSAAMGALAPQRVAVVGARYELFVALTGTILPSSSIAWFRSNCSR